MARKQEAKLIHPMEMIRSLEQYREDCNKLLTYASFILDFMKDGNIGNQAAIDHLQPKFEDAITRVARWNSAD